VKILLVNDYGRAQGGAEVVLLMLRNRLRQLGHDARLFASNVGDIDLPNHADYTCRGTVSSFRTLLQSFNPWAPIALKRVLAEFRPDVVHVKMFLTQLSPSILPLLRDIPSLYHVVWYRPICPLGSKLLPDNTLCYSPPGLVCHRTGCLPWRDWVPLMFQLKLWRKWRGVFDLIVANSDSTQRRLLAEGIDAAEIIPNPVQISEPRSALPAIPTITFAGRLVREKGVDVLLRAFALVQTKLPETKLVVCGEGPEFPKILALIDELQLNSGVSMRGFVPPAQLRDLFRASSVVVVPSIWEEPFGQVTIEAMMSGVAVVASNAGGLAEVVLDGETGFLVPPGDISALANALLRILTDRPLAERLGRASRERAIMEYSEEKITDQFLDVYQRLGSSARAVELV
jgi:glycosyltransferase involved in cell wall biosynthesis